MATRWLTLLLLLACGRLTAAPSSLLDPTVTVTAAETPLDEVLDDLAAQTGYRFTRHFTRVRGQAQTAEDEPPVTLVAVEEPLAQVLAELETQLGIEFRSGGAQADYYVLPAGNRAAGEPAPGVELGDYRLSLASLRIEHVRQRTWSRPPLRLDQDRLTLTLAIDAPSNLAKLAVLGLTGLTAEVDGVALAKAPPGGMYPPVGGPSERGPQRMFRYDLALEAYDPRVLNRLAGEMTVATETRELVFEFEDLEVPQQRLSDDEVDITLEQFRRGAPGSAQMPRPMPRSDGNGAWLAEFTVELPVPRFTDVSEVGMVPNLGNAPMWRGPAPDVEGQMPQVVGELADGRLLRAAPAAWRQVRLEQGRLTAAFTAMFSPVDDPPRRLWVSVVDYGDEVERLGFALTDIRLPAGENDQ